MQGVNAEGLRFRLVDAKGQVVGRLASQIATILMGKDKPTYTPNKDDGDVVVVINAKEVEFTGGRAAQQRRSMAVHGCAHDPSERAMPPVLCMLSSCLHCLSSGPCPVS